MPPWMSWLPFFVGSDAVADPPRGLDPPDRGVVAASGDLYAESHALLIGMSRYADGWTPLPGVDEDLNAVSASLMAQGFAVEVARNLGRAQLMDRLERFRNDHIDRNGRMLIYFAGHGYSTIDDRIGELGFIVPVDAPSPNVDPDGFVARGVELSELEAYVRRLHGKHVLFVFDACFAGTIFRSRSLGPPPHLSRAAHRMERYFITAGDVDEVVPDVSVFRRYFVKGLEGFADTNFDGYVTATELGMYLGEEVFMATKGAQHPRAGELPDPRYNGGEFIFQVPKGASVTVTPRDPLAVREDLAKARPLYEKGRNLLLGTHGVRDHAAAFRAFSRAAEYGHVRARALAADMLYTGLAGGGVDYEAAWRMVQGPADSGDLYARFLRARMRQRGLPEGTFEDRKRAAKELEALLVPLTEAAATTNDPLLIYALGNVRHLTLQSGTVASVWYRKAGDAGYALAVHNMGAFAAVDGRIGKAAEHWKRAAEMGVPMAMGAYAVTRFDDDVDEGLAWAERAIELGEPTGMVAMGMRHLAFNPNPSKEEVEEGLTWLERAAERKHAGAYYFLGQIYLDGGRVERDEDRAMAWLRQAAQFAESPQAFDDAVTSLVAVLERRARDGDVAAEAEAKTWRKRQEDGL